MCKKQYKQYYSNEYPWLRGRYGLRWWCSYFRSPKTFNEIRQNTAAKYDGRRVRGKRTRRNLPTAYDDLYYSELYKRDWKRFTKRKKQWEKWK